MKFLLSGYQPGQSVSELQLKILMPNVTMVLNTSPVLKLILLTLKPQGSITMVMGMCVVACDTTLALPILTILK